jgi:hypothetical protein
MLGTQQATQSANPVTESDQIVGQSKIDGLNREINGLKADVDAKGKEVGACHLPLLPETETAPKLSLTRKHSPLSVNLSAT